MSHWYAGWKFWPDRPKGEVGDAYRQVTWIRPYRPGPLRVLLALAGVLLTTGPAFLSFTILLSSGPLLPRLIYGSAIGLLAAGLAIAITRFFAIGVYVNDAGVRILTMRAMAVYPWRLVTDVSTASRRADPDAEGDRVVITVRDIRSDRDPGPTSQHGLPRAPRTLLDGGAGHRAMVARRRSDGTGRKLARVKVLDRCPHRRTSATSVSRIVIGDRQPEPRPPVPRVGLDFTLSLDKPRIRIGSHDAPPWRPRQVVLRQTTQSLKRATQLSGLGPELQLADNDPDTDHR